METLKKLKERLERINYADKHISTKTAAELRSFIDENGYNLLTNNSFLCDIDCDFIYNLPDEINFDDFADYDDFVNFVTDELTEKGVFDIEIIYYYNAMKFLIERDQSLSESLEIAVEYGYTMEDLNSELLASLLASKIARDTFEVNFEDEFELIKECHDIVSDLEYKTE